MEFTITDDKKHNLETLSREFNPLGLWDRFSIRAALASKASVRVLVEDTKNHPWKAVAYLLPVPALGIAVGAATLAWVSLSRRERAQQARNDIRQSLNTSLIHEEIQPFIRVLSADKIKLSKRKLLWHTTKTILSDTVRELRTMAPKRQRKPKR